MVPERHELREHGVADENRGQPHQIAAGQRDRLEFRAWRGERQQQAAADCVASPTQTPGMLPAASCPLAPSSRVDLCLPEHLR